MVYKVVKKYFRKHFKEYFKKRKRKIQKYGNVLNVGTQEKCSLEGNVHSRKMFTRGKSSLEGNVHSKEMFIRGKSSLEGNLHSYNLFSNLIKSRIKVIVSFTDQSHNQSCLSSSLIGLVSLFLSPGVNYQLVIN